MNMRSLISNIVNLPARLLRRRDTPPDLRVTRGHGKVSVASSMRVGNRPRGTGWWRGRTVRMYPSGENSRHEWKDRLGGRAFIRRAAPEPTGHAVKFRDGKILYYWTDGSLRRRAGRVVSVSSQS